MTGIRRVSQLGTTGESTYVDGSIQTADIADSAITTSKIADGAVIDIDVNASAAIAQSKIANLTTDLAAKAPLASPTFTGNVSLSNGQIITPNQYTYNGDNGTSSAVSFDPSAAVKPPNAYINNGSCFNVSNGRFTLPVAGYVLCSFNSLITRPSTSSHAYVHFEVDGVRKTVRTHTVYDLGGNYQTLNNTSIVYCPANSYITCVLGTPSSATAYGGEWGLGLTFRYLG